jgi:phospholipid transport system substrate-binding protein
MQASKPFNLLGWSLALALAVQLVSGAPAALAAGPLADVKGLIEQIQTILQKNAEKSKRLDLIEKVTAKHLDFREMSQRCLGPTWATLSAGQQQEFVQLFSQLVKASYANHLDGFVKAKVDYQGESCDAQGGEVRLVIIRPNDRIPVKLNLLNKPEGWRIYDLCIEGVSMVNNYRQQFAKVIRSTSYQGLVGCLKAKVKAECLG